MKPKYFWAAARSAILLVNVIGLPLIFSDQMNFDVIAGSVCGVVTLFILFAWLKKHTVGPERLSALNDPFWPMDKHPQAYWLTMGGSLLTASVVGAVIYTGNPKAVQFFGGFAMLSLGITLAVFWAHRSGMARRA